eukprot:1896824-Rhodomonas_salina.1
MRFALLPYAVCNLPTWCTLSAYAMSPIGLRDLLYLATRALPHILYGHSRCCYMPMHLLRHVRYCHSLWHPFRLAYGSRTRRRGAR